MTALEQIYEGRDNAWRLKTSTETYHYFRASNCPPRPQAEQGPFKFTAERNPYNTPWEQLWRKFRTRYPAAATAWTTQSTATIPGLLSWWWDVQLQKYPETCISEVYKAELQLYKHHSSRGGGTTPSIMRYSLSQQLLRQDPDLYRLAVTLRADGVWKLPRLPHSLILLAEQQTMVIATWLVILIMMLYLLLIC